MTLLPQLAVALVASGAVTMLVGSLWRLGTKMGANTQAVRDLAERLARLESRFDVHLSSGL